MNPTYSINYAYAVLFSFGIIGGIIGILFFINTRMRRGFKNSGDDRRIELQKDGGDTLHAEGIYGRLHPEEGGIPLDQERKAKENRLN